MIDIPLEENGAEGAESDSDDSSEDFQESMFLCVTSPCNIVLFNLY